VNRIAFTSFCILTTVSYILSTAYLFAFTVPNLLSIRFNNLACLTPQTVNLCRHLPVYTVYVCLQSNKATA